MKILAVSLLRLGDIFLHQQIIKDTLSSYPGSKIDLVINSQFSNVRPILHTVENVHLFPRLGLQRELIEDSGSLFRAKNVLEKFVKKLNDEKYDLILDLTHTFVSQRLIEMIDASSKTKSQLGYLNNIFSLAHSTRLHYVEALRDSLGLQKNAEAPRVEIRKNKKISIQPLTSDEKKNWGLISYRRLADILAKALPEYQLVVLGAPFEEKILRAHFEETENLKIEILSLEDLEFHLWDTGLLISGDTATLHLAALSRTPVVGLYLGSADPHKTAPWVDGAIIFHAIESCSPCAHSMACSQTTHLCAENFLAESVANSIHDLLVGGMSALQKTSINKEFSIFLQSRTQVGDLLLVDLASAEETFKNFTGKLAWRQIKGEENVNWGEKIIHQFRDQLLDLAVHAKEESVVIRNQGKILYELENWLQEISRSLLLSQEQLEDAGADILPFEIGVREWSRISGEGEISSLLVELQNEFAGTNRFSFYKKAKWTLALISQFLSSKHMIYENLKCQLIERGYNYVSGPGKLS